jgi:hypothetical protein
MEAQRFPEDYVGLIAGAPAANWTRFQTGGHLWAVLATNKRLLRTAARVPVGPEHRGHNRMAPACAG